MTVSVDSKLKEDSMMKERKVGEFYKNAYGGIHGELIATPWGRAAFVNLVTPNTKYDKPKYGFTLLCPKKEEDYPAQCKDKKAQLKEIQKMCSAMCLQAFGKDVEAFGPKAKWELPMFRDGDQSKYDGFPGNWVMVLKSNSQPDITAGQSLEAVKAGMWVRAVIQPYLDKKGFSYKLLKLNIVHDDGVRFDAAPKADGILEALDDAISFASPESEVGTAGGESGFESALDIL
jgi:hypothetical protein